MRLAIIKSTTVKPDLIRYNVFSYDNDGNVLADYEIVLHSNDYTTLTVKNDVAEMEINTDQLKQLLTEQAAKLSVTAGVAMAIDSIGLEWEVESGDNDTVPTDSPNEGTETNVSESSNVS